MNAYVLLVYMKSVKTGEKREIEGNAGMTILVLGIMLGFSVYADGLAVAKNADYIL